MTDGDDHLARSLRAALADREASLFVHAGPASDPTIRYCLLRSADAEPRDERRYAVAFDGADWLVRSAAPGDDREPAAELASALEDRASATALAPRTVPHDAALFLEWAGVSLASTDAVDDARATKTADERAALERAQAATAAGIRRAATALADAESGADGALSVGGDPLTAETLRRELDVGTVAAGGFPGGRTRVLAGSHGSRSSGDDGPLRAGEPIVLDAATRGPDGYHGRLVRTLVVDGDGGWERRAHVALTNALRSARSLLTAGAQSAAAVEADLEAEVRAFGFDDGVSATVCGLGLEPRERPLGEDGVGGSVIRLEVAVDRPEGSVRLGDAFACEPTAGEENAADRDAGGRPRRLADLGRSLEPAALLD